MKVFKKAQSAMEFMITYGWALLVLMLAAGALWYLGVGVPESPEKCILPSGLACLGHKTYVDSYVIVIGNTLQRDIFVNSIQVDNCWVGGLNEKLDAETKREFTVTGCNFSWYGDQINAPITINYTEKVTNLTKSSTGDYISNIIE